MPAEELREKNTSIILHNNKLIVKPFQYIIYILLIVL